MGPTVLLIALTLASMAPERDAVARARELYNLHQYDAAIKAADEARRGAGSADEATLILGRAYLERFRGGGDAMDLAEARAALMRVDPAKLSPRDSVELVIGLGETLYFDGQFGAAAELFDVALATPGRIEGGGRDGLLDWWADSLERLRGDRAVPRGRLREDAPPHGGGSAARYPIDGGVVLARGGRPRRRRSRTAPGTPRLPPGSRRRTRVLAPSSCAPIWTAT